MSRRKITTSKRTARFVCLDMKCALLNGHVHGVSSRSENVNGI